MSTQFPLLEIVLLIGYFLDFVAASTAFWILLGWLAVQICLPLGFILWLVMKR